MSGGAPDRASSSVPDALLERLRSGRSFLISSHANPDGDSIGSSLGLARILGQLGKSALVWNRDPTPTLYRPLPGTDRIHSSSDPPAGFPDDFDSFVLMECPSVDRTGLERHLEARPLINIDHHLGNSEYGAVNWVDPSAPAAGAMVFRIAQALGAFVDTETATILYLTLVTDTGGFRFSNATEEAFRSAAELVARGAEPERVAQWLYESRPAGMVRLLAEMLSTLELHHDGTIATVALTGDMFARAQAGPEDSEGLIDYPRSIAGVGAAALFRELDERRFKVSLRSRGATDVEVVARRNGGGGHRNAAGCVAEGPYHEVKRQIVGELAAALQGGQR